ncbi:MAG: DUF3560 domain-containing protein [Polyangiales bacterium]
MDDFAARRQARIDRFRERAQKRAAQASATRNQVDRIADAIPLGQPILVGHHSEGHARRDAERIRTGMTKSIALQKEAVEVDRRADAAETNRTISSDDPDAIDKLRDKLAKLEANRARMVKVNKAVRAKDPNAALVALGLNAAEIREALTPDYMGRTGFPAYVLTNTSAEARRLTKRIADLEARATRPAPAPVVVGDITIDEDDNRVRIHFPGKPDEAMRTKLKGAGFRWAPSNGAWQRHASATAWWYARQIVGAPAETPAAPVEVEADEEQLDDDERETAEAIAALPVHTGDREAALRTIVSEKQCARIDGVLVDLTTASMLVQILDRLSSPENRTKFLALPMARMASVGWQLCSKVAS